MKPGLLFLRGFSPSEMRFLRSRLEPLYNMLVPEGFSEETLLKLAPEAEVFLGVKIFPELIVAAKKLKVIQVPGAGIDLLDINLLQRMKVCVGNSHSNAAYVAEFAVAMMFDLIKRLAVHDRLMRQGKWFRPAGDDSDLPLLCDTVIGKTIGLIGCGHVGRRIAGFLSGFEVKLISYVRHPGKKRWLDNGTEIPSGSLEQVLAESDVLFVTVPLTPETEELIDETAFRKMKRTVLLVNVSRGPVVSQAALYHAVRDRRIGGAAIDAWYDDIATQDGKKYPSTRFAFHQLDNILLSPYRAYVLKTSPHLVDVADNLKAWAETGRLIHQVDLQEGY